MGFRSFFSSVFAILFFSPVLAIASTANLSGTIDNINAETDLVESGYYLAFYEAPEFAALLGDSATCHHWNEFEETPAVNLAGVIRDALLEGVNRGYEPGPKATDLQSQVKESVSAFVKDYKDETLYVCTDYSTPAYSDGHEVTFVKTGEHQPLMVLVVGYPN